MTRSLVLLFAALLVCVALPARAECRDTAKTQAELNLCADEEFQKADATLNATFAKLLLKTSPAGQEKLKQAQQAWIAYRDAQCEFNGFGSADGSIHPMVMSECYAQQSEAQNAELQAQLDCPEGDPSCGGQ